MAVNKFAPCVLIAGLALNLRLPGSLADLYRKNNKRNCPMSQREARAAGQGPVLRGSRLLKTLILRSLVCLPGGKMGPHPEPNRDNADSKP